MDQECVDLNAYLVMEYRLLKKIASLTRKMYLMTLMLPAYQNIFFDEESGWSVVVNSVVVNL